MVQGHFQVAKLDLAASSHDVDYVIASRRSRYRAGLRYQRRGIDDEAHVANFVETEAIVRIRVGLSFGQSLKLTPCRETKIAMCSALSKSVAPVWEDLLHLEGEV